MSWVHRARVRRAAAATTALLLMLAVGVGLASHVVVRDQERRLLRERANEVGLVFTSSVGTISGTLGALGAVLKAANGAGPEFDRAAAAEVATGPGHLTYAVLRPTSAGFVVLGVQGGGLTVGQLVSDARTPTLSEALTSKNMVATPVIGRTRLLGFALGPPAAPAGTVLYRESALGPVSAPRQADTAPFHELNVVLYAAPRVDARQLLVTTTRSVPLRGSVRDQLVPVGSSEWLLAVSARGSLVGSTAAAAPWATLIGLVVGALLVGLLVEVEGRRRDAALASYAAEHRVAETLQRSLLPELPALPGLDIAARYLAGAPGQQVGGDWFDVFAVEGGRVGVVIGDVMGHDLVAAAAMSHIRAALRAYAWQGDRPGAVLDQLDRFVTRFATTPLVTVFFGVLEPPASDGSRLMQYANAGHLPPLVVTPDGQSRPLAAAASVLIGAGGVQRRDQGEATITVGSTLLLFTDGLVEVPGTSLDESLDQLAVRIAGGDVRSSAEVFCDDILDSTRARRLNDDVALLVIRVRDNDDGAHPAHSAKIRVGAAGELHEDSPSGPERLAADKGE